MSRAIPGDTSNDPSQLWGRNTRKTAEENINIYHINLLKNWNPAPVNSALSLLAIIHPEQSEEDSESELDLFEWTSEEKVETIDGVEIPDLTLTRKQELEEVMKSYPSIFNVNPRTIASEHYIHVAESAPICQKPCHSPYSRRKVEDEVQRMLEAKVIHPSCSPWPRRKQPS